MSLRGGDLLFPTTLAPYASAVSNLQLLRDCFGEEYTCLAGGARENASQRHDKDCKGIIHNIIKINENSIDQSSLRLS